MKIGILGAGAIGASFGGRLQAAGHEVAFLARGATLEALNSTGVTIIDATGEAEKTETVAVPGVQGFAEAAELLGGLDVAIIASKALPGNETFGSAADRAALAGIPVVTTHNSVEIPYLAAEEFGEDHVLAGVARVYATREAPATVRLNPGPFSLSFGPLSENAPQSLHKVGEELAASLTQAGATSTCHDAALADVWAKAMFVTTTGALGAVVDKPLGYLLEEVPAQLEAFMREVDVAARSLGVGLREDEVERTLGFARKQYPGATTSMQRDIKAGLPNELDAQVGAIRRMGARGGVDTPLFNFAQDVLEAQLRTRGD
ncbi:2-dehydropantoate 2-reductase [Corynebacterium sp.]|uniref:2-dehydropantoate 2-reductase n=1 Tax=Corynebacterium sp. TaxID=1720 RepID=UPI0026DD508C|nr:2-dehydropantoate 2-reductase [Corynebacterium sp.]MDO5032253.1 2-dehydropantoate 2-reductase [Corynebacterium sp.]